MNVLHIIPGMDPADGGPSAAMVGLAEAQHRAGLGVRLLTCAPPGTDTRLIKRLRGAGVEVTALEAAGGLLTCPPPMRQALSAQIADAGVVHIHALWEPLQHYAAAEARHQKTPYIFRPCGMLTDWSMAQKQMKKRVYYRLRLARDLRGAAAIHFTTEREQELSRSRSQGRPGIIAPNGVDTETFTNRPPAGGFRRRYNQLADRRIVLFVGRLHPVKGIELLIRAFAAVELANTALALVGSGDKAYVAQLQERAEAEGIADRVLFTGGLHGEEKLEAFVDADLFVLPSHHENFGMVVVESLACGTPVLLSDQVAICREIEGAGVGQVVSIEGLAALRDALPAALETAVSSTGLAVRCQQFVMSRYNWDTIALSWCEAYARLARRDSAAGR